jgi:hypothetical protein
MILLLLLFYKDTVTTTYADVILSSLGEGAERLPVPSCDSHDCRSLTTRRAHREHLQY